MIPEALRDEEEDLRAAAQKKRLTAYVRETGQNNMTGIFHGEFDQDGKQIGSTVFLNESKDDPSKHAHNYNMIPSPADRNEDIDHKEMLSEPGISSEATDPSKKISGRNVSFFDDEKEHEENIFDNSDKERTNASNVISDSDNEKSEIEPSKLIDMPVSKNTPKGPEPFEKKRLEQSRTMSQPVYAKNVASIPVRISDDDKSPIWSTHETIDPQQCSTNEKIVGKILRSTVKNSGEYESPVIKKTEATIIEKPHQMEMFEDRMLSKESKREYHIIGQVFDTYWILEFRDKLYMVDQHAAHEKVNFEHMMKRFKEKQVASQMISPPVILTLSAQEKEIFVSFHDYFEKLGFQIDEFGGSEYAMRAVPTDIYGCDNARDMFMEILDELTHDAGHREPDVIYYKIASMACKASVKGNMHMTREEMEALIDELLTLDNPYNCPHGRPTIISMSKYEIEKRFKRVVD
jgi:DNA mismatch repair protein MutL